MVDAATRPITAQWSAAEPARGSARLLWVGALLAFVASCATLVLELVAGRMLAPFIGVSLYTWTAIIGVVLAGVSLGNWLGGRLADRHPSARLLGGLFLLGGLASLATLGLVGLFGDGAIVRPLPLLARIFLLTSLVFLPPSLVLGMVTPLTIRLALPDVRRTGRVVGVIYAAGTLGSLVGNFLTGFVLTALYTVNTIVLVVALALVLVGGWILARGLWGAGGEAYDEPDGASGQPSQVGLADQPDARPGEPARNGGATPGSFLAVAGGASQASRPRPGWISLAGNTGLACGVVIVSSFATMGIELAASRILAPYVGLSLYSWTGIIGAVLAGIAVGNYLGGRIADRWPSQRVLGLSLFVGGLASLAILVLVGVLDSAEPFRRWGLMERIVALTSIVFFGPVLVLGTISPQVIRLAVTDLARAGQTAGQIYAWSTAGAIVGTFATGWWLISALGVHALVFAMGLMLLVLALVVGRFWQSPVVLVALLAIGGGTVWGLAAREATASRCTRETNYFCIRVREDVRDGFAVRILQLDHLIHSYVKLGDPSYLGYEHEYVQAEITRYLVDRTAAPRVLLIGGGGYTYPRWVEASMPEVLVEVVEIDPGVTEVVHDHLGLPRDTRIRSYNLDGRQFVHELAPRGEYGLVVQDAVNDLSVPYHIMTREYNEQVRALLAPDGAYLLTVIDLYRDGQLLRASLRTMRETFPQVQLLSSNRAWEHGGASVWVVAGSQRGIDLEAMRGFLQARALGPMQAQALEPERLQQYIDQEPRIILTDQYAPVDNLIAPLFTRRG